MAMICVLIRPGGDKDGYRIVSSVEGGGSFKDKGMAWASIHRLAMRYPSILVIEFDHRDNMKAAYAIKQGLTRDLHMMVWQRTKTGFADY